MSLTWNISIPPCGLDGWYGVGYAWPEHDNYSFVIMPKESWACLDLKSKGPTVIYMPNCKFCGARIEEIK